MAAPGYLCDGCHRALEGSTRFGDHSVMAQMEVQGLYNIRGVFTNSCTEGAGGVWGERGKKNGKSRLVWVVGFLLSLFSRHIGI